MEGEKSKIEVCKDTGKQIIQATGKVVASTLTLGKAKEDLSGE